MSLTTDQIRNKVLQAQDLLDRIDEYKSYISQLTDGVFAKCGNTESNKQSIRQYNECIVNLESELQHLWNSK